MTADIQLTMRQANRFLDAIESDRELGHRAFKLARDYADPRDVAGNLVEAARAGAMQEPQRSIVLNAYDGLIGEPKLDPLAQHVTSQYEILSQAPHREGASSRIEIKLGRAREPYDERLTDLGAMRERARSEFPGAEI